MLQRRPAFSGEIAALRVVQGALARPPVVAAARGMSVFGEHAAGWLALGAFGVVFDRHRRHDWLVAVAGVAAAHGAAIAVKRVVRRPRPQAPGIEVLAGTPSPLSFPSSHATSTTAAAVVYGGLLRRPLVPMLVPPMLASRIVLGVHYPSDVLAGSALGALLGAALNRQLEHRQLERRRLRRGAR